MEEKTTASDLSNPKPDFIAELVPHRSLSTNGFIFLMVFVGATCFLSGIMFLIMGAWPVFLFMALDVLVIWLAFKINYRSGRIKERVYIGRNEFKVEHYDAKGRVVAHVFNPFGTRFEVSRHELIGITDMRLKSRERTLSIGAFLNPDDRESFADAFSSAIADAKR